MTAVRLLIALSVLCGAAASQSCQPEWRPGDPVPYATGSVVTSVTWDPDGAGPAAPLLVCGGDFSAGPLGDVTVAAYDGAQWRSLGTPSGTITNALAVVNGALVAATVGPIGTSIAAWDSAAWVAVGTANGWVHAMATHNGALLIGGAFSHVSGVAAANVAQFDANGWSALGSGVNGTVRALASFNGALHVGGSFSSAGGVVVQNHALWNSPSWFSGVWFNGTVETFAVRTATATTQTYLFAGGEFTAFGATPALHVARLTQSTNTWSAVGAGIAGTTCKRLFVRTFGISSYELTAAMQGNSDEIWRWSGSAWAPLGVLSDDPAAVPRTLAYFGGAYVVGLQDGVRAVRVFDGVSEWAPLLGLGIDERVSASCSVGSEFVIGGSFRTISGVAMNGIARGTPGAWQPMGSGMEGGFGVFTVLTMPNGDVVAGGLFTTAGGVPAANIARWNGTSWSPLGGGTNDGVHDLALLPNGDLVAAGRFTLAGGVACNRIARWNGVAWAPLGSGSPSPINALHVAANGDLLVGGNFTTIGGVAAGRIAKWNGTWSALGGGTNGAVIDVTTAPNGDVVIGGAFDTTDGLATPHVARWNGSAWSAVGSTFAYHPQSIVYSVAVLPDGDVVACGEEWSWGFSIPPLGSITISGNVARFDAGDGTWSSMGVHGSYVQHVRVLPEGGMVVGGLFERPAGNFGLLEPTCPALASSSGVGCSGRTLTAATLPWVNATFRAVGTNLPTSALVLTVTSVSPVPQGVAPLAGIFAQGLPGCDVLVAPDILGLLVTANGTATSQLSLPDSPPLVGVTFFHQMIPIGLDTQGAWTSVTATNALQLTAGIF